MPIVFMFSGQGSQYYHMGKGLFDKNPIFKEWMHKADRIYQSVIGRSVIDELYNPETSKSQPFTQTLLTHPAIFMVEYALLQILYENKIQADFILGSSMGEFAAAVAAGALDFESALYAVSEAAQAFENCVEGGMLAILYDTHYYDQELIRTHSELAAVNFDSHFVVTGANENLQIIIKHLLEKNIPYQLLPVSRAFHSSLINSAKMFCLKSVGKISLQKPMIPYISCVGAGPLFELTPTHFWDTAREVILFQKAIEYLESQQKAIYLDVGPSGTLATFVKYNLAANSQSKSVATITPFGDDEKSMEKALASIKEYSVYS